MAVDALEDRLTPSTPPLSLADGGYSLSGLQSTVLTVLNDHVPATLSPIELPPIWTAGQPPLPAPGNGIFAADVYYTTATGQTLTVPASNGLLTFAYDLAGNPLQLTEINGSTSNVGTAVTLAASGSMLTANPDGSFTYVPAAGFQGDDSFNFTVSDGANSATVTADITVTGPQIFLSSAAYNTNAGQTLNIDVADGLLAGAVGTSGNALQVTAVSINSPAGEGGPGGILGGIKGIFASSDNILPSPINSGLGSDGGGNNVAQTGSNIGTPITLSSGSTLTVNADGSLTYVPAAGFTGDDTFFFTVSDGSVTATAQCDISVIGAQLKVNDTYFTAVAGQTLTVNADSGLLASAYDSSGAAVTVTAVNGASLTSGSATVTLASGSTLTVNADGSFAYTPIAGFQGDDTFTITASDGTLSTTANGDIYVTAPELDVPDASFTTFPGQNLTVNAAIGLLAYYYDPSGAIVSVTAVNGVSVPVSGSATVTLASGSTLTVNADGSFSYAPGAGFQGDDAFTFTASDGTISTTAHVDVNVTPPQLDVFDASFNTGTGQTLTLAANAGLLNYVYDTSGNPLTISQVNGIAANVGVPVTLGSGATLTVNADGSFTYVPAAGYTGDDTFTFTVNDGLTSATANADINVVAPKIFVASPAYSTLTGQTLNVDAGAGLVAYAVDTANNLLEVTAVNGSAAKVGTPITLASGATLTVNADGAFSYVPAAGYQGQDSFDFTVADGTVSANATATVSVVTPQFVVPDRFFGGVNGQTVSIDATNGLLAWVQDPTGNPVQVTAINGSAANVGTAITLPSGATLTVNADGSFAYVPVDSTAPSASPLFGLVGPIVDPLPPGEIGSDSFTFTVSDGTLSGTATATIFGKPAPIASPPIVAEPVSLPPIAMPPIFAASSGPSGVDFTLAVNAKPQTLTVKPNAVVTLSAPTSGSATNTVQWQVSTNNGKTWSNVHTGPGVQSESSDKLVVSASRTSSSAQYRAQLVNRSTGKPAQTTNAVTLNLVKPPSVAVQASSLKVAAGQRVTLTATVKGTAPITVQWQVQTSQSNVWTNINGATSLTMSFTADATDNGNRYRVIANNSAGTADSTAVTLNVTFPPTVTLQPTNQTVLVGTKATFTATAAANPAPAIQWQVSVNQGKTWTNLQNAAGVQGVHSSTLTITAKSQQNGIEFRAVFTSSHMGKASAITGAAVLTVQTPPPVVTVQPVSQTAFVNAQATFTATATGAAKVQWQISTDDGLTWTNVRGATGKALHVKAILSKNGNQFRAVFSNAGATTTTQAAVLTVTKK